MYTREQVLDFLNEQSSVDSAIENIDGIGTENPAIINLDTNKVLFYFDKTEFNTQEKLKNRIIKHMRDNDWETRDREADMQLKEIFKQFNLKLRH